MHFRITQEFLRMDFFVQREAAPLNRYTGAQQLPVLVARKIRPINHHQNMLDTLEPTMR
jgi:hypothetical protein